MAPTRTPRGRPSKVAESNSPASSRPASPRRSSRFFPGVSSKPGQSTSALSNASPAGGSDSESPDILNLGAYSNTRKAAENAASRESLSSIATPNDYTEASGYSTPATSSAITTPAPLELSAVVKTSTRRGRRPAATVIESPAPTVSAVARAAALRNSQYSLNPTTNKRKRAVICDTDDEGGDIDADEDNSRDAQLARALQNEEDEDAAFMDTSSGHLPRRSSRKAKDTILTSHDLSDMSFGDDGTLAPVAKRPKVILNPRGNPSGFKSSSLRRAPERRGQHLQISDSEDSAGFILTDDSEDDDDDRIVTSSAKSHPTARAITTPATPYFSSDSDDSPESDLASPRLARRRNRAEQERNRLVTHHPDLLTMWQDLENLPKIETARIEQPTNINRELKPFQLEGVAWMKAMEETEWGGGLLGDEMGMGKTIQAVSLIMSDFPASQPSLVLIPPVALMQWQQEIADYTDGTLKTFVFHGTNSLTKGVTVKDLMKYNVILMSYNSLESMYRKQEKGFKRKAGLHKEKSVIHQIKFHRVILDEAHNIKQRTTGCARACFALKADHKWCLSGTPLQNRIGEFFSLVRFLDIRPFACYFCKQCPCSPLNWDMNEFGRCKGCNHSAMQHVSVFNQELLNPIQKFGNNGPGKEALRKLRILTNRFMLRRVKRDHSSAMELPSKEIYVDRQFFGEEENDFASSIMNTGTRKFETYVAQGVLLNNYANIFGLIMQMRQVADHPDLILKKNSDGGQNILVCCICDETAEEAIRSACRHEFCRECAKNYLGASDAPDCPTCHIPLSIDLEQPDIAQDEQLVKKSSIINRIKMENWTSSSKIEALVHDLYQLRSKKMSSKSIIFSQFTTMLQLVEWRLRRAGITTVMLDGSMTPAQRQASINHFMTDVNVECFLVSLKAGGVALNLTEASKVFIIDPWWNPAAEWQSADRCHRIGQSRPCSITRLCIEDSVESRMVLLQEKKANMINSTINADDAAMESLTPEDMQFLFRGT